MLLHIFSWLSVKRSTFLAMYGWENLGWGKMVEPKPDAQKLKLAKGVARLLLANWPFHSFLHAGHWEQGSEVYHKKKPPSQISLKDVSIKCFFVYLIFFVNSAREKTGWGEMLLGRYMVGHFTSNGSLTECKILSFYLYKYNVTCDNFILNMILIYKILCVYQ